MRQIPLTQGKVALVDDSDFEWLNQWKWCALKVKLKCGEIYYAVRRPMVNGKLKTIYMHRLILNDVSGMIDHSDGSGVNNQRKNIRPCTPSQNQMNRGVRIDRYKGVWFQRTARKWTAQISVDGRRTHLGYFDYSTDAAIAYNAAATKFYGEFARLNTITD